VKFSQGWAFFQLPYFQPDFPNKTTLVAKNSKQKQPYLPY
jgi:hypothetical protein